MALELERGSSRKEKNKYKKRGIQMKIEKRRREFESIRQSVNRELTSTSTTERDSQPFLTKDQDHDYLDYFDLDYFG